jgi:phosphoglucosamine mutase
MLRAKVRETRADLGIALDGDADRVLLVDERGQVIDGDQVIALIAQSWAAKDRLSKKGAVATVMSNLGLERFLNGLGLSLERTAVGDRYVVEHMRKHGFNLGGEASGHIVLSDYATTGDGLIAALQVLAVIAGTGKRASEVCHLFEPVPQLLQNVRFRNGLSLEDAPIKSAIEGGRARLADRGRLVIRKSGTEPLIRVMAEGDDGDLVKIVVGDIVAAIEKAGH